MDYIAEWHSRNNQPWSDTERQHFYTDIVRACKPHGFIKKEQPTVTDLETGKIEYDGSILSGRTILEVYRANEYLKRLHGIDLLATPEPIPTATHEPTTTDNQQQALIDKLFAEFGTYTPTLEAVAEKYLHISNAVTRRKFNENKLPFPAFKPDANNRKSPVLVHLTDLAKYLINRQ